MSQTQEYAIVCPSCGNGSIVTTLMGFMDKDMNHVSCRKCGHHGTAWDWQRIAELRKIARSRAVDDEDLCFIDTL